MDKEYEFKKVAENKYAFVMRTSDIERTEVVSEDFARTHYKELAGQKSKMLQDLQTFNKKIKESSVEFDDEMEKFIAMANKAAQYREYQKACENREGLLKMLEEVELSMKRIEATLPVVKRLKK